MTLVLEFLSIWIILGLLACDAGLAGVLRRTIIRLQTEQPEGKAPTHRGRVATRLVFLLEKLNGVPTKNQQREGLR